MKQAKDYFLSKNMILRSNYETHLVTNKYGIDPDFNLITAIESHKSK